VAIGAADLILRRVLVPSADTHLTFHAPVYLAVEGRYVVELAGPNHLQTLYIGFAIVALGFIAFWPRLGAGMETPTQARYWWIAVFSVAACVVAASFSVLAARSDIAQFSIYFYALFVCATMALAWRSSPGTLSKAALATAAVLLAALSITTSVRTSHRIQEAMGPWSVQTLDWNYRFLLGPDRAAHNPAGRRLQERRMLRAVGVTGDVGGSAFGELLCAHRQRLRRGLDSQLVVPEEYAWQGEYYPPPAPNCRRKVRLAQTGGVGAE
jgi:hypothetical protein